MDQDFLISQLSCTNKAWGRVICYNIWMGIDSTGSILNVYQVGSELGLSANTVLRYIKDYFPYIPYAKEGRAYRFTTDSFPAFRYIQKQLLKKKTREQIMANLLKKFPPAFPDEMIRARSKETSASRVPKKVPKSNAPLLDRVASLEARLFEMEKIISNLQKDQEALKGQPSAMQRELSRLKRLIEG